MAKKDKAKNASDLPQTPAPSPEVEVEMGVGVEITDELRAQIEGKSHAELMDMVDTGEITEEQLDALMSNEAPLAPKSTRTRTKRKTAKYDGPTKICKCVVCGVDVEVTKFATPSKVYCDEHRPKTVGRGNKAKYEGKTKICPCIDCGIDVEVTKFASPSSVRCAEHRKEARKRHQAKTPRSSGLYIVMDETVLEDINSLREERVMSVKPTLHDNVYEISAVPALLSVLETYLNLEEFIEADTSLNGDSEE